MSDTRQIPVRRMEFDYASTEMPPLFAKNFALSHIAATLSASFPKGEEFFVRSVRHYRDQIIDPALREQVAGFIGQEAIHGKAHRDLNDHLVALGYPTDRVDENIGRLLEPLERLAPPAARLALTACLEHFTAVVGATLLRYPELQAQFEGSDVQPLLLWHALEETEHKAVAFDVYEQLSGNYVLRAAAMLAATIVFGIFVSWSVGRSMATDRRRRGLPLDHGVRSLLALTRTQFVSERMGRRLLDYYRPGFHPSQHRTAGLTSAWRERLFGADGTLVDRVKVAS